MDTCDECHLVCPSHDLERCFECNASICAECQRYCGDELVCDENDDACGCIVCLVCYAEWHVNALP